MEIVARATVVFFFLFLLTRGLKKRALAEMSPFEMILLVALGDIVQQGVTQEGFSLTGAVLAAGTFGFWVTAMTWGTWRSDRLRNHPQRLKLILSNGPVPAKGPSRR